MKTEAYGLESASSYSALSLVSCSALLLECLAQVLSGRGWELRWQGGGRGGGLGSIQKPVSALK